VFRALTRLEADGLVRRVELGDGKARYESEGAHHEHVRCERCGTVGEVPGCVVGEAVPRVQELTGFRVTGHQILFSGVCPKCS
jgi:Fe2+ or Zn2+ uptake regulation protein